jgi:hypothetical protein
MSDYLYGTSARYVGASDAGSGAWIANAATGVTHRVGLYSSTEFTHAEGGIQSSEVTHATLKGYYAGYSQRYGSTGEAGRAVWIADGGSGVTTRVGLYRVGLYSASEFTYSEGGVQSSEVTHVTLDGQFAGYSQRYNSVGEAGRAAWIADGESGLTTRVGFYNGAEFVSTSGVADTEIMEMTMDGYLFGYSNRYQGDQDAGRVAWMAKGGADSVELGLVGDAYQRLSDGYRASSISWASFDPSYHTHWVYFGGNKSVQWER